MIRYGSKVTRIDQNEQGVTVTYKNSDGSGEAMQDKADWCVCTLPLSILSQIPVNVSQSMQDAIRAVPYDSSVKIGLQFKRRFWEEDEHIYGGISYTNTPSRRSATPALTTENPARQCYWAPMSGAPMPTNSPPCLLSSV